MVTQRSDNVDIGANPSAEEGEEALDETTKQVNDVIHGFQLSAMFDESSKVYPDMKALSSQLKCMWILLRVLWAGRIVKPS